MQHMLDPDDGDAFGMDRADGGQQRLGLGVREAAGNLVEQEKARRYCQGACKFQSLSLKQGEGARANRGFLGEAGATEHCVAMRGRVPDPPPAGEIGADEKIFECRHILEGLRHLVGAADALRCPRVGTEQRDIGAVEGDMAGIRPEIAADQTEQRAFAGAVRPDDADRLARRHPQRNGVGNDERAIAFRQARDRKQIGHGLPWLGRVGRRDLRHQVIGAIRPPTGIIGAKTFSVMTRSYL